MPEGYIKNFDELATTENRRLALNIVQAGFEAINTQKIIESAVRLSGDTLSVKDRNFDLSKFKRIKVIGFGKASCDAAVALEKVLGQKISEGAVIGLNKVKCDYIESFAGSHPRPSPENIMAGKKIFEMAADSKEDDLIIVAVSGGGSALLCWPEMECGQGKELYDNFLKSGKTIREINTVRKHLSLLKGGGLAKLLYPATVVGLIFSDVPGDHFEDVASGPTYMDKTTIEDAQKIIDEYKLGSFDLIETPKEDKYFEKVSNIVLVSNKIAVEAMAEKARNLNLEPVVLSSDLYDKAHLAIEKIFALSAPGRVVLAAGEPKLEVSGAGGSGGRNLFMGLEAVKKADKNSVFISFASDGMDNSDAAGAVVDGESLEKSKKLDLDLEDCILCSDAYDFFKKSDSLIFTGPTNTNVSDLMILLSK